MATKTSQVGSPRVTSPDRGIPAVTSQNVGSPPAEERGRPLTSPDRGRPMTPKRGTPTYSSVRWAPLSRDYSPHLSPDRVTRNISPGRQKLDEDNMEVG